MSNIAKKVAVGAAWSTLMRVFMRVLGLISVLILARLLVPEDYGLISKAILLSGFLELITQFGFNPALIRDKNATKQDYQTVWTLNILRGVILCLLTICLAGAAAEYFEEPNIKAVIYVYAVILLINGFINIGIVDFQKDMRFDRDFQFNCWSKLVSFMVTVSIAYLYQSYWAFPLGSLAGAMCKLASSFIMSPFRPWFSLASFSKIFNFSKWFFVYELIAAISAKADTFILSKWSGNADLGLYTMAKETANIPSMEVAMPVARSALPGLATLSDNLEEFKALYLKILTSVMIIALPATFGLSVLSESATLLLLGQNWIGAAVFIQIMAISFATRVNTACAVSALTAYGRADLLGKYSISMLPVRLCCLGAGFYIGGVIGIVWGLLLSNFISLAIILIIQHRLGILLFGAFISSIWRVFTMALVMAVSIFYCKEFILSLNLFLIVEVGLLVLLGVILFFAGLIGLCRLTSATNSHEYGIYILIRNRLFRGATENT